MSDNKGLIFHTIHGSFVDGHGIRTTIFLKGCPLHCLWCCNPEGQNSFPELKFTPSKCSGCSRCIDICPTGAIELCDGESKKAVRIDRQKCDNCGKCTEVCYEGSLEIFGEYKSVEDVFNNAVKDEAYYRNSGGGITIGGGEPTYHADFTYELMKKLQERGIHVAIDTCGYVSHERGLQVLKEADLLLFDVKGIDPEKHLGNTGVKNKLILGNLKLLDKLGKPIIVRVPLIPGYNDSEQDLDAIAELLASLKSLERVDLLGYHEFGRIKHEQLGREYQLHGLKPLSEERLQQIKKLFEDRGLTVQIGG
jgi:pyruvate formate lyase activating enzyme